MKTRIVVRSMVFFLAFSTAEAVVTVEAQPAGVVEYWSRRPPKNGAPTAAKLPAPNAVSPDELASTSAKANGVVSYWSMGKRSAEASTTDPVRPSPGIAAMPSPAPKAASQPAAPVRQPGASAAAAPAFDTMVIKTHTGKEKRQVTRLPNGAAKIPALAGKTLYFGGTLEDGVRSFAPDGTGTYIDGENTGNLEWGYGISNGRLIIKTFKEWQEAFHMESDEPAAELLINFTSGSKSGESYAEIVGCPYPTSRMIFVSPNFATKE